MPKVPLQDYSKAKKDEENLITTLSSIGFSQAEIVGSIIDDDPEQALWCRRHIGETGAKALSECLKVDTNLITLIIEHTNIGDKGAGFLAEGLKVNTSLIYLCIGNKNFGEEGVRLLAEGLKVNTSLRFLALNSNDIGDKGMNFLAEALKFNTSLMNLNLSHNDIGDEGMNFLAEALKFNTSLTSLDFSYNNIGSEGVPALLEGFKVNKSIIYWIENTNYFPEEVENLFRTQIGHNKQSVDQLAEFIANNFFTKPTEVEKIKGVSILSLYSKVNRFSIEEALTYDILKTIAKDCLLPILSKGIIIEHVNGYLIDTRGIAQALRKIIDTAQVFKKIIDTGQVFKNVHNYFIDIIDLALDGYSIPQDLCIIIWQYTNSHFIWSEPETVTFASSDLGLTGDVNSINNY